MPTVVNDVTILRLAVAAVIFLGGYLTHELLHAIPLALARANYRVSFAPGDRPLWYALTVGRVFEFETDARPAVAIVSLLAPGLFAIPGVVLWAQLLGSPVISLSSAIVVATWIVAFLPSLADWREASREVRQLRG